VLAHRWLETAGLGIALGRRSARTLPDAGTIALGKCARSDTGAVWPNRAVGVSQDRASTRSSFRGRAGLSERPLTPMGAGGGAGCASGDKQGVADRRQETSRDMEAGPPARSRLGRLRARAAARQQVLQTDAHDDAGADGVASLAGGENLGRAEACDLVLLCLSRPQIESRLTAESDG
jgi:hypothetical protein